MNSKEITNGILKALLIIIGVLLLLFFLYKIQSVLVYIGIAAVVSLISRPLVRFLKGRLKFPNSLAVITTMSLLVAVLMGIVSMFIPLIIKQGENLSLLNTEELHQNIAHLIAQINDYLTSRGINVIDQLKSFDFMANFKAIPNLLNSVIATVGSLSIGLFSVLFISFFFMKDSSILNKAMLTLVPNGKESLFKKSFSKIKDLLSRYFIGLVFQILILFIIYTIVLLIFGIQNAIVIAFLCALLNLIPYVGPLIGGLLMLFLSMSSNIGSDFQHVILPKTSYVMIGYLIAQLIDNFFSQPIIFSKSVKSHPLEIFLVIIIGGLLFGITGMVFAVPTYTALKVIFKEFLAENKIVKSLTKNF